MQDGLGSPVEKGSFKACKNREIILPARFQTHFSTRTAMRWQFSGQGVVAPAPFVR
jgi:hypothetical protein